MSSVDLKIVSEQLNYDLSFVRRINVIKGDSGTGKTSLVDLLTSSKIDSTIQVFCNLDIKVVTADILDTLIKGSKDSLILIDEVQFRLVKDFALLYKTYSVTNNLYFVLITREMILGDLYNLSFSIDSIFRMCTNGIDHWLEQYYCYLPNNTKFDLIITEDTTGGFDFFSALYRDFIEVRHSKSGKSTLILDVRDAIAEGYNSILVMLDSCAYGCHMEEFDRTFADIDVNVSFISCLECFEELLLHCNPLNTIPRVVKELNNLSLYANQFLSWERYFENLLQEVSRNKAYKYVHGRHLGFCYLNNCSDGNQNICKKCDAFIEGNKLVDLLKGTKYEFILDFRE